MNDKTFNIVYTALNSMCENHMEIPTCEQDVL